MLQFLSLIGIGQSHHVDVLNPGKYYLHAQRLTIFGTRFVKMLSVLFFSLVQVTTNGYRKITTLDLGNNQHQFLTFT